MTKKEKFMYEGETFVVMVSGNVLHQKPSFAFATAGDEIKIVDGKSIHNQYKNGDILNVQCEFKDAEHKEGFVWVEGIDQLIAPEEYEIYRKHIAFYKEKE